MAANCLNNDPAVLVPPDAGCRGGCRRDVVFVKIREVITVRTTRIAGIAMPPVHRTPRRKDSKSRRGGEPAESRASEALTIAWTVSVTGVVIADLLLVAAHFYAGNQAAGQPAKFLEALLLFLAAAMGAFSLGLLPIVWRVRRLKPPQGYVAFAVLVAIAPIATMVVRLMR